jgi:hypothetical protein
MFIPALNELIMKKKEIKERTLPAGERGRERKRR